MQEVFVIVIVLLAAFAAIYHLICSFKAMSGKKNPCQHCVSSCNCRLIQEEKEHPKTSIRASKEAFKARKERKIASSCKKKEEKSC